VVRRFAVLFALLLALGALVITPATISADSPQETTYRQFINAINQGNASAAIALLTDDVSLQGTPGCLARPCQGKVAVGADIQQDIAGHLFIQQLGTVFVSGNTLKSNTAHRADIIKPLGISRVIINETFTFTSQGDKISKIVFDPQTSDPQTARLVAILTAPPPSAQPASPPPVTPVAITAPATGDGGLLVGRGD
jgi:hypothetical protein